jgi:hypothetical protein
MRQIDLSGTGAVEISTDDPAAPSHICELVSDSGHQALLSAREKSCTPT